MVPVEIVVVVVVLVVVVIVVVVNDKQLLGADARQAGRTGNKCQLDFHELVVVEVDGQEAFLASDVHSLASQTDAVCIVASIERVLDASVRLVKDEHLEAGLAGRRLDVDHSHRVLNGVGPVQVGVAIVELELLVGRVEPPDAAARGDDAPLPVDSAHAAPILDVVVLVVDDHQEGVLSVP